MILFFLTLSLATLTPQERSLIEHVKNSITLAEQGRSQLTPEVLAIEGMSSPKVRNFLNNLCAAPDTRYLEIGCWKGSTLVAALYGNNPLSVAIDNWSQFGGPFEDFQNNCATFLSDSSLSFYSEDCFGIDPTSIIPHKVNVYFYDGDHSRESQAKAFLNYTSVLDDTFVAIVDDWYWEDVRKGTEDAFKELGYVKLYEADLPGGHDQWWNGLYVAVVSKVRDPSEQFIESKILTPPPATPTPSPEPKLPNRRSTPLSKKHHKHKKHAAR